MRVDWREREHGEDMDDRLVRLLLVLEGAILWGTLLALAVWLGRGLMEAF